MKKHEESSLAAKQQVLQYQVRETLKNDTEDYLVLESLEIDQADNKKVNSTFLHQFSLIQ